MPELPDIAAYIHALEPRVVGKRLVGVRLASAFLLRTVEPPIASVEGQVVRELRRVGKRIAFGFDNGEWMVLHLMIAGRLHWRGVGAKLAGRNSAGGVRLPEWVAGADRGGVEAAGVAACAGGRGGAGGDSIRAESTCWRQLILNLPRGADGGEPDAEAGADRSADCERDWKCLFG